MVDVVVSRAAARALSARCVSRVDGIPILVLSIGETCRLLRGIVRLVSVGVVVELVVAFDESIFIPDMLEESVVVLELGGVVVVVAAPVVLSDCWLCVGVGAAAPVPSCWDDESVVVDEDGVVVIDEESVVLDGDGAGAIDEESVVVDGDGVVVVDDGVVVIDEESVVVEDDGVVVVEGDVVTSPVDVACEPSFETRM